uniref:CD209 antigen-like protein C n=1 Tax=Gadus morhua TaxID=8049 RepID=A0A8C5CCV6_GADMO
MVDIYVNVDTLKPSAASPNQPGHLGPRAKGTRRSRWGPAVLGLGLLCAGLLAGLLVLAVRYSVTVKDLSMTQSKSMEQQKELCTLSTLKQRFDEQLKDNIKRNQTCPEGWRKFENACYHHSDQKKSWNNGRNDCIKKGGDLVVIDSSQEQKFLLEYEGDFWIGLTDLEQEGTWKWVDGAPLILSNWAEKQPDNGNKNAAYGEEDCAHSRRPTWNDVSCDTNLRWICETSAEDAQISMAQ